jgi:acyl dehydratase
MSVDPSAVGRRYGPFHFAVGLEDVRDFAVAVAGGVPGRAAWGGNGAGAHPYHLDEEAGRRSPWGSVIASPTFAATFAMQAFAAALTDPAVGVDLSRLVHGEQELELFGPIRPGDRIETDGEIAAVVPKSSLTLVKVVTTSLNQRGELVVKGTWTAAIRGG